MSYAYITIEEWSPQSPFDPILGNTLFWINTNAQNNHMFNIDKNGVVVFMGSESELNTSLHFVNVFQSNGSNALNKTTRYMLAFSPTFSSLKYEPAIPIPAGANRIDNGRDMSIILESPGYEIRVHDNNLEIAVTYNDKPMLLIGRLINRLSPLTRKHIEIEQQEDILFDMLQQWLSAFVGNIRVSAVKLIE